MRDGTALTQGSFAPLQEALNRACALARDPRLSRLARALDAVAAHVSRPMRIAIMGEQNSGKSSIINMLMRESVVPAGALAGMKTHLLLRHGPEVALHAVSADGARARLTSKALARMAVPEFTPATPRTTVIYSASDPTEPQRRPDARTLGLSQSPANAPAENATKFIEIALPRSVLRRVELVEARHYPEEAERKALRPVFRPIDLTLWCTLATQAWKETERQAWRRLPASLRRNAILTVTYKDAIFKAKDEARLLSRLQQEAGALFGGVILLSSRQALDALSPLGEIADAGKWERSGATALETAIEGRLSSFEVRRMEKAAALLARLSAATARIGNASLPPAIADSVALHFERLIQDIERRRTA
jgi:hypothetical protein